MLFRIEFSTTIWETCRKKLLLKSEDLLLTILILQNMEQQRPVLFYAKCDNSLSWFFYIEVWNQTQQWRRQDLPSLQFLLLCFKVSLNEHLYSFRWCSWTHSVVLCRDRIWISVILVGLFHLGILLRFYDPLSPSAIMTANFPLN